MLTKILENNRNFITAFIITVFSIGMFFTIENSFHNIEVAFNWFIVMITSVLLIVAVKEIGYFRNQYFSFFVMLFSFFFWESYHETSFFLGVLFLSVIFSQLLINIRFREAILNAFDLGFFAGFFILFYPPFIIFLLPMWFYYLLLGKIEYMQILVNLLGLVIFMLCFFVAVVTFDIWYLLDSLILQLEPNCLHLGIKDLYLLPIVWVFIVALNDYVKNLNRHSIHKKSIFLTTILFTICGIVFMALWGGEYNEIYLLLVGPIALFYANYLTFNKNNKRKEIYVWLVILSLIIYKFYDQISFPKILSDVTF